MAVNVKQDELDELLDRAKYNGLGELECVASTDPDAINVTVE